MIFYLLVTFLLLAACGEQPSPERQAPQAAQPAPTSPDSRPAIVAFGDSRSAGFGVDSSRSYPELLQRELDRRGLAYRVVNAGISGDTSSGGLQRIDTVTSLKPAIVILELGANDGLRGIPVSATRSNLQQIVRALRNAGAKVVLAGMTLPPNYGPDYIRSFEQIYKDLAAEHKLPLIPFFLEGVAGTTRYMQQDGLHPNAAGYRKVAEIVMAALDPLLSRATR